ncbi:response regulator transcription factor [Phototrophicus methaneseepsis]|uniref:Response regulator transcription factor n=1 Tax=Phototrophicus methaneseepsis TaxID=2710758 RepID=A0A7S8EB44_9CHLR|nr:response regulator transcription factor [Phototrophicus methaneseepsis]QPC83725.1 response regulator transcription factor [Phototrophicus methaneseepsis]
MPDQTIRLLIVDDHAMVRRGLATFLKASHDFELVGEAGNAIDALRLCEQVHPHVVLMDLMMPEMSGIDAIPAVLEAHPDVKIIALTSFKEQHLIRAALRAGATSYLLKNVSAEKLSAAIRATYSGMPILSPELTDVLTNQEEEDHFAELTQREREVLTYMVEGLSNEEIAQELVLSASTVKNHVSSILAKLSVSSRAKATNLAIKHNLVNSS